MAGKSEGRKSTKNGQLWLPECLVNFVDFHRKERPPFQLRQGRQIRIFSEQRTQFLPGRLRQNVGEIALGEFGAAHWWTLNIDFWKWNIVMTLLHIYSYSSAIQRYEKSGRYARKLRKYFGVTWINVEQRWTTWIGRLFFLRHSRKITNFVSQKNKKGF